MEDNAVCLVDLKLLAVHHHIIILVIHPEECHRVGLVIEAHQIFVIREQRCILGILTAHRQIKQPCQLTRLLVDLEQRDTVIPAVDVRIYLPSSEMLRALAATPFTSNLSEVGIVCTGSKYGTLSSS